MFKNIGLTIIFSLTVILAAAGFFLGKRIYQNDAVHGFIDLVDLKDESCQAASIAPVAECPMGCLPRPVKGPEEMKKLHECRSKLWVWTCTSDCETREGLVRLPNGQFAESDQLVLQMSDSADGFQGEFEILGIDIQNGISGLYRYRAKFINEEDSLKHLVKLKERLEAMPEVLQADYVVR